MILSTTDSITGGKITEVMGLVRGSSIRSKHLGKDIGAALKSLVGGELKGYSELLEESREEALNRMIEDADRLGANAVVALRFGTSQIMSGAAEILVYGTAVKMEK